MEHLPRLAIEDSTSLWQIEEIGLTRTRWHHRSGLLLGIITFDGGSQAYNAESREKLYEQIATGFVSAWCHERDCEMMIREHISKGEFFEAVRLYFEDHEIESLDVGPADDTSVPILPNRSPQQDVVNS